MGSYVTIARIVKTRGIKGEVAAVALTEFPERFASTRRVRVVIGDLEFWEVIDRHWFHKDRVIFKFKGRNRPHEVEELVGGNVQVPETERFPLPEETFYHSDLVGCLVVEGDDDRIGRVVGVLEAGTAGSNLVIRTKDQRELMVPLARPFVRQVDVSHQRIAVSLPESLWDTAVETRETRKKMKRVKRSADR